MFIIIANDKYNYDMVAFLCMEGRKCEVEKMCEKIRENKRKKENLEGKGRRERK